MQQEKIEPAIESLEKICTNKIDNDLMKEAKTMLGECYLKKDNLKKCQALFEEVIEFSPSDFVANINLGAIYLDKQEVDKAIECYRKALRAEQQEEEIYQQLLKAYKLKEDHYKTVSTYLSLIKINPKDPLLYYNAGVYYSLMDDYENAFNAYTNAAYLEPNFAEAHSALGDIFFRIRDFNKAKEHLTKSQELAPNISGNYFNLSNVYTETGEMDKLFDSCSTGLRINPGDRHILFNLNRARLLNGELEGGWDYFMFRRDVNEKKELGKFLLDYNGSLEKKTVLVYWDSGYGDSIQFMRYLPLLAKKCKKVYLSIQEPLREILEFNDYGIEILPSEQELSKVDYDFHINTTSLTYLFKPKNGKIHFSDKYVRIPEEAVLNYKQKYLADTDEFKVGIIWYSHANTFRKNVDHLNEFAPIAKIPGVKLYSLQQTQNKPMFDGIEFDIVNLGDNFNSFMDTAAAIENMDLVIAIDTAAAHLAGAMQKPVWVMLPKIPNWRWALEGSETPWYESMKLFRQTTENSWESVIAEMAEKLTNKIT